MEHQVIKPANNGAIELIGYTITYPSFPLFTALAEALSCSVFPMDSFTTDFESLLLAEEPPLPPSMETSSIPTDQEYNSGLTGFLCVIA
ncbi:hypothetical protein M404DRAFT_754545 [Pisolithus tinctorius Marx 270]|uniref:Uncharacterized protein n=1 Tax=Pisolithus tinctorius Marx 270 TaxID=870435 RepID=A0A0C3P0P2_PISTI|nr:hypothetical protein M404DRAFT_754545 [Pisolithus tinctorius Marx 270]